MAYDAKLADRVRRMIYGTRDIDEQKLFGGRAFMLRGHMACGVMNDELVVRLSPADVERALMRKHTRAFDFTGRVMRTMVYVGPAGLRRSDLLRSWVGKGLEYAASLTPK